MNEKHTFAICAYKESEYLELCIQSIQEQTKKSQVIMCTSTPNKLINTLAEKYRIPLYINTGDKGITQDWNFALRKSSTKYVTIAHQDDIYESTYTEKMVKSLDMQDDCIIGFSNYYEIRNGNNINKNKILRIKRYMNIVFKISSKNKFIRRRVISLGDPICCPAVIFNREKCPDFWFNNEYKVSCDWEAWSRLAEEKGRFIYIDEQLMGHRIYEDSTTTEMIKNGVRLQEDKNIYQRYWPDWMVKILLSQYKKSMDSNTVK